MKKLFLFPIKIYRFTFLGNIFKLLLVFASFILVVLCFIYHYHDHYHDNGNGNGNGCVYDRFFVFMFSFIISLSFYLLYHGVVKFYF